MDSIDFEEQNPNLVRDITLNLGEVDAELKLGKLKEILLENIENKKDIAIILEYSPSVKRYAIGIYKEKE
jgi:hypothetical protein